MKGTGLTAVDLDLEVQVQSGAGTGGSFDPKPLADTYHRTRSDPFYQCWPGVHNEL
jgi:hypothetical protein